MDLVVTWWNCRLTPPATGATKYAITKDFDEVIRSILEDRGADVLGLCEVAPADIAHIEKLLQTPRLSKFKVVNLYKSGRSIDDFCLIYNSQRLTPNGKTADANARDPIYNSWLKAGVLIGLDLVGFGEVYIGLSHWQGRGNIPARDPRRMKLGTALRSAVNKAKSLSPKAPIILCGDYNDEPFDDSIVHGFGATRDVTMLRKRTNAFFNPFWPLVGSQDSSTLPPGAYLADGKEGSSMLFFDQILFSSTVLQYWNVVDRLVINEIPPSQWKKISDHYPISIHLRSI